MISKAKISFIKSLHSNKVRNESGLFIAEGTKIASELLKDKIFKIHSIYATKDFLEENNIASNKTFEAFEVSETELQKISLLTNPNKVLIVVEKLNPKFDISALKNELTIVLDNVQDPGNLGTIIRTMDWFGIKNLICSENTVDFYNPKVIQATMGSFLRINTHSVNLEKFIVEYCSKFGYKIYGTLLEGNNIYNENLEQDGLIVFGNESKGISANIEKLITNKISIPKFSKSKNIDSLNISIAAGIVFSEFKRKS